MNGGKCMKYKLICCEVFLREACLAIAATSNTVDPEFTPKNAHENSNELRKIIQEKIDSVEKTGGYDAILLGYGLCGNGTAGIAARSIPLVIPRAHDCCTIFLGSKSKFIEYFKDNLSAEWSSTGYMERGGKDSYLRESDTSKLLGLDKAYEEYVEQYGEENAKYLWEMLHPKNESDELIYIKVPETEHLGYLKKLESYAEEIGKRVRVLDGDMRLIRGLVNGDWNEDEYLVVPPGETIKPVYDHDKIITC
ncbi:hypothetical protein CDQ84_17545 [Clostridium thermosuccinogenes]|uniref:DUF1638 domain-containing protein n=2 Tax=Clostridium thermosuccinogenes TaxID=84032 RepID=A0A2K2F8Q8_9CLOT|nr:hypothetical protein CDO33_14170 [Pseudoclostridium thermosuccinogenes]PNT93732.1 hypothetical protein CDQ83_09645 [Pseudoclostridium thermosuccinogenes]PNT94684.1 hypothetical protein CDQ85_17400 [Pseudoclostridium thermosuccinogenes]PNT95179.1 hypothetical protein CDQ84_17545 [Pseudoclostridium thermosuccinogenes]